ncbi:MAG: T9SS type A sorting domain-containing protein [Candidatus Cloacimonetes bacterium]|nr:T9SS type A sorting domain-containing protein [Candidatus Cloacimonadota bacterium]
MKKVLLIALCFSFIIGGAFAKQMLPTNFEKPIDTNPRAKVVLPNRDAPSYSFYQAPMALATSHYDYMIGSYNSIPIRVIPDEAGGGYFLTFHGKESPSATRRVYYAYIESNGNPNVGTISTTQNGEGYPTVARDPVSGKPMYAWHANHDTDAELEVQFTSDGLMFGMWGLFNTIVAPINNPTAISYSGGSTNDNEFIWPTAQIGPSPNEGMSRVYVLARNSTGHLENPDEPGSYLPSENIKIAYADFNGDIIEAGTPPLSWSYTTIPELDEWNNDLEELRRPNHAFTVDSLGNLYYIGYHNAWTGAALDEVIDEPDVDVFINSNYGEGEWTRISVEGKLPSWNPADEPDGTVGYFVDEDNNDTPYTNEELTWQPINASHLNASVDNLGRVHAITIWGLFNINNSYYINFMVLKNLVFDPSDQSFEFVEVFPKKHHLDTYNQYYQPWDLEEPFGEPDEYYYDEEGEEYYLQFDINLPFPHYDNTLHDNAMFFHYNSMKISEVNDEGLMVAVWQDSHRADYGIKYPDDHPEWVPLSTNSDLMISVSSNNGDGWSEPIRIHGGEVPEFAGIKPMWVYPADKVKYIGESDNGKPMGRIGFMFYNDYTWGAECKDAPNAASIDGGQVMFMEMDIEFPAYDNTDPVTPAVVRQLHQNYPNPFNPETTISFDMPVSGKAKVDIFNVKGQLVKTLFDGTAVYGKNTQVWNGTDNNGRTVTSGIYFYRLSTENHSETRKMMLMK